MTIEALLEENQHLKKQVFQSNEEQNHLKEQVNELTDVIDRKDATIHAQIVRIKEYIRRIYGKRSEKLDPAQMVFDELILAAEKYAKPNQEALDPDVVEEKVREHVRRKHPGRKPLPPELERVEHYLDIPEEEKITAEGKERPLIGMDIIGTVFIAPSYCVHTKPFLSTRSFQK